MLRWVRIQKNPPTKNTYKTTIGNAIRAEVRVGNCLDEWTGNNILHTIANTVTSPIVAQARRVNNLPSWMAVFEKVLDLVTANLLGSRKLLNAKNSYGWTPLHVGVVQNNDDMCTMLVRAGEVSPFLDCNTSLRYCRRCPEH